MASLNLPSMKKKSSMNPTGEHGPDKEVKMQIPNFDNNNKTIHKLKENSYGSDFAQAKKNG